MAPCRRTDWSQHSVTVSGVFRSLSGSKPFVKQVFQKLERNGSDGNGCLKPLQTQTTGFGEVVQRKTRESVSGDESELLDEDLRRFTWTNMSRGVLKAQLWSKPRGVDTLGGEQEPAPSQWSRRQELAIGHRVKLVAQEQKPQPQLRPRRGFCFKSFLSLN